MLFFILTLKTCEAPTVDWPFVVREWLWHSRREMMITADNSEAVCVRKKTEIMQRRVSGLRSQCFEPNLN